MVTDLNMRFATRGRAHMYKMWGAARLIYPYRQELIYATSVSSCFGSKGVERAVDKNCIGGCEVEAYL